MTSTQQPVTATQLTQDEQIEQLGRYEYGWADADVAGSPLRAEMSRTTSSLSPRLASG